MKPYIICHMMASIDGRIDCDMTERIGGNEYYEALEQLACDSDLSGRITAAMHIALPEPFSHRQSETGKPIFVLQGNRSKRIFHRTRLERQAEMAWQQY